MKQFLKNTNNLILDSTAEFIYKNQWLAGLEKETSPDDPKSTDTVAVKVPTTTTNYQKVISDYKTQKEDNLLLIKNNLIEKLYNFGEVSNKTCPICQKGYSQLESKICVQTEVYKFSLGYSLY